MENLLPLPSTAEPTPADLAALEADFSDLEDLLSDSLLALAKAPNRRTLKDTKKAVDTFLTIRQEWRILENIQVWEMIRCSCGHCGTITFVRNMQRRKKCGQDLINICTVAELEPGVQPTMALCTRQVNSCEYCADLAVEQFRDFQEVIKPQEMK